MKNLEEIFNKLHPDENFKKIVQSDECRLIQCWLDYGRPTKTCRHHALAYSHYLRSNFNNVFPVNMSQADIDAALLTHGKYNCKIYYHMLKVGIPKNSPLFDIDVCDGINFSMGSEIQDMIAAYEMGKIMSHITTVAASELKIKKRQRDKEKLNKAEVEIKKIHKSSKGLVHKTKHLEDVVPGINAAITEAMPGIGEVIRLIETARRDF